MKLFQLKQGAGVFMEIQDYGDLRPFSEVSLLLQIMQIMDTTQKLPQVLVGGQRWLVFSPTEEAQVAVLSEQIVGGLKTDQGLGHGMSGSVLLLTKLLSQIGLYVSYFPANKDAHKLLKDNDGWLLALQGL